MRDGICQIRPIEGVEVEFVHPIRLQQPHLLCRDHHADHTPRFGVVRGAFKQPRHPRRDVRAAHVGKLYSLLKIGNGHDSRHDRRFDSHCQTQVQKSQIGGCIKEILRNCPRRASIQLAFQVLEVAIGLDAVGCTSG